MITLTQEKREELANYARARLASHVVHGGCSDEEDIFKIALASLTAEPIAHADCKAILKMLKGYTRFFTSFPERSETKRVDLFTAPPVPEIKFPEKLNAGEIQYELTEKYGLDVSINQLDRGLAEEVYSVAVNNFERLNGLGE